MTEFRFQFIPNGVPRRPRLNSDSDLIEGKNECGDFTNLLLENGEVLEVDSKGGLAYRFNIDNIQSKAFEKAYARAKDAIDSLIESDSEYNVCLLIGDNNPLSAYSQAETEIEEFSENRLGSNPQQIRELSNTTLKVSFGRTPVCC